MSSEYEKLRTFLSETQQDLDFIVFQIMPRLTREPRKVISEELLEATIGAWKDLQRRFNEVSKMLYEVKMERFQEVGLSGRQLDFKIEVFHFLHRRFKHDFSAVNWHPRFLRRLLKAIDSILGSLSILIPLLHPITEFKDALDSILP